MHIISFTLSRADRGPLPTREELTGALERAAVAQGVEHVRVHVSRAGARGVMFVLARSSASAAEVCLTVCRRALADSPLMRDWTAAIVPPTEF